jgi:hypothetical protein
MRATKLYAWPADGLPQAIYHASDRPRRIVFADFGVGGNHSVADQFQQPATPKWSKLFPTRIPIKPFGHRYLPTSSRAAARDGWIPRDQKKEAKTQFPGYNKEVECVQTFGVPIPSVTPYFFSGQTRTRPFDSLVRENSPFLLESTQPVGRKKGWPKGVAKWSTHPRFHCAAPLRRRLQIR